MVGIHPVLQKIGKGLPNIQALRSLTLKTLTTQEIGLATPFNPNTSATREGKSLITCIILFQPAQPQFQRTQMATEW